MQIDAVIARLKTRVPALRSVEPAADMMALMAKNALPANTPAAHVVPAGLRGGAGESISNAFTQEITESLGVVVTFRNVDAVGKRGLDQADAIIDAILAALSGWAPQGVSGVCSLTRGAVLKMEATTMVYLLEFAIPYQLRIIE